MAWDRGALRCTALHCISFTSSTSPAAAAAPTVVSHLILRTVLVSLVM